MHRKVPVLAVFAGQLAHPTPRQKRQAGFSLVSMLGALALMILIFRGFAPTLAYFRATPEVNETAAHMEKVVLAAGNYVRDHYGELTASVPLNGTATTIPLETLKDFGYLSPNLVDTNPLGQSYSLRVRYVTQGTGANTRNVLEPLVVTEGGHPFSDALLIRIAGKLPAGGSIRSDTPSLAIGNNGGWQVPLASFGGTPGAGHLAVGMFYSDAGMIADYLYRNAVPGHPEVNAMNTGISMQNHAIDGASTVETGEAHLTRIVTEASACEPDGALARDAAGAPLTCKSSKWSKVASFDWLDGQGQRMQITGANGQSIWIQNINGRFRWVNSDWTVEVASVDQSGNITGKRLNSKEYVQIDGVAVEGQACSPVGLVGRDANGLLLSCQSGVWRKQDFCAAFSGDLNGLETSGCYNGAGLGNAPTGDWLFVEVMRHYNTGNYYVVQRASGMTGAAAGQVWVRSQQSASYGAGWGPWTKQGAGMSGLYLCPSTTDSPGGGHWATFGCVGQVSSSSTCGNMTNFGGYNQWYTYSCTPL